jgi:hypothetical protein
VRKRHRSAEFIEFLELANEHYPVAKTLLRGIRVTSADELKARIELYLKELNETPVVFRWKYKLDTLTVVYVLI